MSKHYLMLTDTKSITINKNAAKMYSITETFAFLRFVRTEKNIL